MSKREAVTVTCGARLYECECGLDPHPPDVPHECVDPDPKCGGSWLDHPTDPTKVLVVRWPGIRGNAYAMAQARRNGLADIGDPAPGEWVEEPREQPPFRVPRGPISFLPPGFDAKAFARRKEAELLARLRSDEA